jgi:hypothetical protein
MEARANEPDADTSDATVADLRVAIRLVARGLASCVTIVGVADPEAAAAAVGVAPADIWIEIVPPSVIRVRRLVVEPTAALEEVSRSPAEGPRLLMSRPARA